MKKIFFSLTMCVAISGVPFGSVEAQNPIIGDQFTADPTARVFNNKVYLYPSHDIPAPEAYERKDWFCMEDYHVFSSENLVDWLDHGVILSQEQVPWGKADAYSMWAPDCVERNGRYYFYYPNAPREGRGFAIGVATADAPEGPFAPEAEPIKGVMGIDPCVLVDGNDAYIYWSGMGIRGARLKGNMKEIDGEAVQMEGLPDGFKEGPFVFQRKGWYYLTFPWLRGKKTEENNPTETLAYAMSKSPLGPWQFKGIIMAEHANGCWTNHHSIVEYKGQWLLFYHHNDYSPRFDKNRSACIDRLFFNADGTIQEVKPTMRGVGTMPATHRIDIDRYSAASCPVGGDIIAAYNDSLAPFRGWHATIPAKASLRYNDVDFSSLQKGAYVVAKVRAAANTGFAIKTAKGKRLALLGVTVTGEGRQRRDMTNQWMTVTAPLALLPQGTDDLYIENDGAAAISIDWLQFKNRPQYFSVVNSGAAPSQPDNDGFLRRWNVLEPIAQDIRSNVVFTDTWLRKTFAEALAQLPKQPKKKWHTLDAEGYNLKLFHVAEQWGKQLYGNLFWVETVVDSPEELSGVRLAAGSNGASMWWLNDDEVLLLSGDRRMVRDDGVSGRLMLRKGRNVLRCAVINGPGMSDMCARFVDEKGNPITNLTIQ